jgi:hypothetical protein
VRPTALVPIACFLALAQVPALDAQLRRPAERRPSEPRRPAVALLAGPSPYDLAGTGTGFAAALRFDFPSGRLLVFEPGIGFFRYENQSGDRITYLLPELSVQIQVPSGAVRPYVGGGIGFSEFLSGRGSTFVTLHAATGLRVDLGADWGLRGEWRLRSIDPFTGNTSDLLLGVSRRFGRP